MAVDWSFLQDVEGKESTTYIPMEDGKPIQNSGVTIGTGVDLGQQSEEKFRKLGLPDALINKLSPFFGKTKDKAAKALQENGEVTLDDSEIMAIDKALKQSTLAETKKWFNKTNTVGQDWSDLSDRQQTVILSVRYNHGPKGAPNFYRQVTSGDWSAAIDNLLNFYPSEDNELHTRRVKEAQYLTGLPKEQIDGISGPITAKAVDKFKSTVGVSTPDRVQPEEPQIGSVNYLDNLMATIQSNLATPPEARRDPIDELSRMVDEDLSREETISRGERRLAQTYKQVTQPKQEQFSEEDEKKIQELMAMEDETVVLRETTNPTPVGKPEPEVREDDPSKDPIYGLF